MQHGRKGTVTTSIRAGVGREDRRLGTRGRLNPEIVEGAMGDGGPSCWTRQETNGGLSLAGEGDVLEYLEQTRRYTIHLIHDPQRKRHKFQVLTSENAYSPFH